MPTNFKPIFTITPLIVKNLAKIEASKEKITLLPINPTLPLCVKQPNYILLIIQR